MCENGICKCGTSSSCAGLSTGAFCDSMNNVCKCSSTVASCAGNVAGAYCDSANNVCKCTATLDSCPLMTTGAYCDAANNKCKCTSSLDACTSPETCDSTANNNAGACKCGSESSCVGQVTGELCDGSGCKCSSSVDKCSDMQTCDNGQCKGQFPTHCYCVL